MRVGEGERESERERERVRMRWESESESENECESESESLLWEWERECEWVSEWVSESSCCERLWARVVFSLLPLVVLSFCTPMTQRRCPRNSKSSVGLDWPASFCQPSVTLSDPPAPYHLVVQNTYRIEGPLQSFSHELAASQAIPPARLPNLSETWWLLERREWGLSLASTWATPGL